MSTIRPELYEAVRELSELPGPTGHEDAVQDWIADRWSRFADVQRTRVDNVIAKVGGSGRKLMIMGHADEICYMVKSVTDSGFIHLWPYYSDTSGYPPKWMLPLNQPALVLTESGTVPGFFATTSGHAMSLATIPARMHGIFRTSSGPDPRSCIRTCQRTTRANSPIACWLSLETTTFRCSGLFISNTAVTVPR